MTRPEQHVTDALGLIRAWPDEQQQGDLTPDRFKAWHSLARQYEQDHEDPLALTGGAVRIAKALAVVLAEDSGVTTDDILTTVYKRILAAASDEEA